MDFAASLPTSALDFNRTRRLVLARGRPGTGRA